MTDRYEELYRERVAQVPRPDERSQAGRDPDDDLLARSPDDERVEAALPEEASAGSS
jgi:hypothetical protein